VAFLFIIKKLHMWRPYVRHVYVDWVKIGSEAKTATESKHYWGLRKSCFIKITTFKNL